MNTKKFDLIGELRTIFPEIEKSCVYRTKMCSSVFGMKKWKEVEREIVAERLKEIAFKAGRRRSRVHRTALHDADGVLPDVNSI